MWYIESLSALVYNGGVLDTAPLDTVRRTYQPKLPPVFQKSMEGVALQEVSATEGARDAAHLQRLFPHTWQMPPVAFVQGDTAENTQAVARARTVGIILSGGQAPGGHNVICGLRDAMARANPRSQLYGFLGGPAGLLKGAYRTITAEDAVAYRNSGGFDMIGSGRTKIESPEQFRTAAEVCTRLALDALVIVGGDDSNTNAALLAEYFKASTHPTVVVGAPKTIDGDLKNRHIELSFGFDTATKTYSELIGNICRDAKSARKYWHFIKLMGRSASHIALECALQTHPNVCIISEEVAARKKRLAEIVTDIADVIAERHRAGEDFGIVLIPEGLIEFIPEMGKLITELNEILATQRHHLTRVHTFEEQAEFVNQQLGMESSYAFSSLPFAIQRQLLLDRDPHGNVQVSRIETEQLLIDMVQSKLQLMEETDGQRIPFATQHHFLGYEGRCAYPTNFDADYCYAIGYSLFYAVVHALSGYIIAIHNLQAASRAHWRPGAVPIISMMNIERRHGKDKPVIQKGFVDLSSASFRHFHRSRSQWARRSDYRYPGAVQYFGPPEVCDCAPLTLQLDTTPQE